jgi:hypothetical protein
MDSPYTLINSIDNNECCYAKEIEAYRSIYARTAREEMWDRDERYTICMLVSQKLKKNNIICMACKISTPSVVRNQLINNLLINKFNIPLEAAFSSARSGPKRARSTTYGVGGYTRATRLHARTPAPCNLITPLPFATQLSYAPTKNPRTKYLSPHTINIPLPSRSASPLVAEHKK